RALGGPAAAGVGARAGGGGRAAALPPEAAGVRAPVDAGVAAPATGPLPRPLPPDHPRALGHAGGVGLAPGGVARRGRALTTGNESAPAEKLPGRWARDQPSSWFTTKVILQCVR